MLHAYVFTRSLAITTVERIRADERGEGVISAAIAVLIMAFLGAAMWLAFKGIFNDASNKTSDNVNKIGS
ncbi:MAG: hypothetical protein JO291_08430 [Acidimicrobiia bacterium]|nr:hypothetical protein [Acidimicrobiia bacterium]